MQKCKKKEYKKSMWGVYYIIDLSAKNYNFEPEIWRAIWVKF